MKGNKSVRKIRSMTTVHSLFSKDAPRCHLYTALCGLENMYSEYNQIGDADLEVHGKGGNGTERESHHGDGGAGGAASAGGRGGGGTGGRGGLGDIGGTSQDVGLVGVAQRGA